MASKMKGVFEFNRKITQVAKEFPNDLATAMYQEGQIEVTEMKRRCPVDMTEDAPHPGNLRASIHVKKPQRKGNQVSMTFATGKQAPYAVYVHENPDAFHEVGEWKFMESVLNESRSSMGKRIAARVHLNKRR